jgi:hypothetical protein
MNQSIDSLSPRIYVACLATYNRGHLSDTRTDMNPVVPVLGHADTRTRAYLDSMSGLDPSAPHPLVN